MPAATVHTALASVASPVIVRGIASKNALKVVSKVVIKANKVLLLFNAI